MAGNLKIYWRVFGQLLRLHVNEFSTFRFDTFTKLVGYPLQLGMMVALWALLKQQGAAIDEHYLYAYYALIYILANQYPFMRLAIHLQQVITNGNHLKYILSGVGMIEDHLAEFLVKVCWYNLLSIPIALVFVHAFTGTPFEASKIAGFYLTALIGGVVVFLIWLLVAIATFWLVINRGLVSLVFALQALFTGTLVPLSMLPEGLAMVSRYTPFFYALYAPVDYYLTPASHLLDVLVPQVAWVLALFVLCRALYNKGIHETHAAMV